MYGNWLLALSNDFLITYGNLVIPPSGQGECSYPVAFQSTYTAGNCTGITDAGASWNVLINNQADNTKICVTSSITGYYIAVQYVCCGY